MNLKSSTKSTISVKPEVKERFLRHIEELNQKRHSKSKIIPNDWLTFFIDNMTDSQVEGLRSHKMTILDEQQRIRSIYEKENSKVSDEKWELLKISGVLKTYFKKHSIISLDAH